MLVVVVVVVVEADSFDVEMKTFFLELLSTKIIFLAHLQIKILLDYRGKKFLLLFAHSLCLSVCLSE
jgi:hypothetical protein